MTADLKIDYLEFPAADLEAAKSFYAAVFNWAFEDYGPAYCSFSDGRLTGGFYKADRASTVASGSVLVVLYAEALEATAENVEKAGGTIVKPVFDFPGGRRFHFHDPNGNELAVWSDR
jgi:predicted enzyme related to lactoylglutathione lyase